MKNSAAIAINESIFKFNIIHKIMSTIDNTDTSKMSLELKKKLKEVVITQIETKKS